MRSKRRRRELGRRVRGKGEEGGGNGWKKILFLHFFFQCRNFWPESFCFYWKVATKEKKFFMRFNARI